MPSWGSLFDDVVTPGEVLRQRIKDKGWTQEEFAVITGKSRRALSDLIGGKSALTPEMAVAVAAAFGDDPAEWLRIEAAYQLRGVSKNTDTIQRLADLFTAAPIRDMQKRGWILTTTDPQDLEAELIKFYGVNPLDSEVKLQVAAKRSISLPALNPAEKAWCFRARQLSNLLPIRPFNPQLLAGTQKRLRELAAFPKQGRHVPKVLTDCGIRFVVVEPLPGSRIDGAAFWTELNPVIAISLRHDRIDGFWFTLMHEFAHIINEDASVDVELFDGVHGIAVRLVEDAAEYRANEQAADSLVPKSELDSFIRRVGPLYPRERVIKFANKVRIHPGIIVGQLQFRKELGYSALRPFLVKVRDIVTSTSLTDGWDQIPPQLA